MKETVFTEAHDDAYGNGSLAIRLAGDLATVGKNGWDQLTHPSIYNSYDWLTARSRFIAGTPKFIFVTANSNTPIAGFPCYLVGENSHPGYEPIGLLTDEGLLHGATDVEAGDIYRLRDTLRLRMSECRPAIAVTAPGRAGGISYSKHISPRTRRRVAELAVAAAEREAGAEGARTVSWMYILEGQDDALDEVLRDRGYASVVMGAECYMPVTWSSFDDYLFSFRSTHRNKIRREMAALIAADVRVDEHGGEILGPDLARLEQQWRAKYGRVSSISAILDEYTGMRHHMDNRLHVFTASRNNRFLGFTTFLANGDVWYAGLGGFDYSATDLFLYYNLLFYYPLQSAIRQGVSCIRYTQKSYEAKRSRGCLLRNILTFIRLPGHLSGPLQPYFDAVDRIQRERFARIAAWRISR
jgi:predicted N-acyltransferase